MSASSELACVYAALILQDDEVAITGDKIATLLKAANVCKFRHYFPLSRVLFCMCYFGGEGIYTIFRV